MSESENSPSTELDRLIAALLDGRINDDEWRILRQQLMEDAAARDSYRKMRDIHALLVGDSFAAGEVLAATDAESAGNPEKVNPFRGWKVPLFAAAASLAVGLFFWISQDNSAVTVTQSIGATFSTPPLKEGVATGRDEVILASGLLELAFPRSEASVIIEAPARFRVVDHETLWLESGRLTADVRNGAEQGLRVLTPDSDILDLGTRFAVDAIEGRGSEVHVFEGKVATESRLANADTRPLDLIEGDAVRVAKSGEIATRELRRATFIHGHEVDALASGWSATNHTRWSAAKKQMKEEEALVAYIDFESDSFAPSNRSEGARRVQGRFPGTVAMEFLDEGDHVELDIESVSKELTMMAWVRLDHVASEINSIYHTDDWDTVGQVHWAVAQDKQLRFSLFGQSRAAETPWPESKRSIIADLGRWVFLASTYDSEKRTIRFYIDGEFDNSISLEVAPPARLGPAQIGNWKSNRPHTTDRRLSGRLDELVILRRALGDEEIADWFEVGNPYDFGNESGK